MMMLMLPLAALLFVWLGAGAAAAGRPARRAFLSMAHLGTSRI
jgi:hypothetical protein